MNRQTVSPFRPLAAALLAALGIAPLAAQAATIVVVNGGDMTGTTISCTLRQAIVSMNVGAITGTGCTNTGGAFHSNDTINFNTLEFPSSGPITLANGQLSITDANLTIDATANGNVMIDAANNSRVMYDDATAAGASLTLNHLTLVNGNATTFYQTSNRFNGHGGGIFTPYANLTLSDSTVNGNAAFYRGGGICALFGSVKLTNSTVSGNRARAPAAASLGGGISSGTGSVTLTNSTVSGNLANSGGAGIYFRGGHLTLTNSTLSGNSTYGPGGGIDAISGSVALTDSTVSANTVTPGPYSGGGIYSHGATLVANNSIVAGNSAPGTNGTDIHGTLTSGANNLIGGNPMLGALADNGGPTQTMLPQTGSPAINAAPCLAGIGTDQRGDIRPDPASRNLATPCDIGAVEANSISQSDEIFYNGFEP